MSNYMQPCDLKNDLHAFFFLTTDENEEIPYTLKCECGLISFGDHLKRENERLRKENEDLKK